MFTKSQKPTAQTTDCNIQLYFGKDISTSNREIHKQKRKPIRKVVPWITIHIDWRFVKTLKIESEWLLYIPLNQCKLRSEEYIHLRDPVINDGNVNPNELGEMVILPATFTWCLQHMLEYTQDAITYVRPNGHQDFFTTFTCYPKWNEI